MQSLFASTFRIKTTTRDDPLNKVYGALPHDALVGGSYALKDLTDATWENNDIDVFVGRATKQQFDVVGHTFQERTGAQQMRDRWFEGMSGYELAQLMDLDEKFHASILGTKNYTVPTVDIPVQLICMHVNENETVRDTLNKTVDLPACVTFSVEPLEDGTFKKRFEIPPFGLRAITTRIVPLNMSCRRRVAKYTERGYTFE